MFDHGYWHFIFTFGSWVAVAIGTILVGLVVPIILFGLAEDVGKNKSDKYHEEKQVALNIFGTFWLLFVGASIVYFLKQI